MTIVRRFECSLADTKKEILEKYEKKNNNSPVQFLYKISGYQFYSQVALLWLNFLQWSKQYRR